MQESTMPQQDKDEIKQAPGTIERGQAGKEQQQQRSPGQPSPRLKDKDAETSDTYGNTRESGEQPN
jgi:hypothetical protein